MRYESIKSWNKPPPQARFNPRRPFIYRTNCLCCFFWLVDTTTKSTRWSLALTSGYTLLWPNSRLTKAKTTTLGCRTCPSLDSYPVIICILGVLAVLGFSLWSMMLVSFKDKINRQPVGMWISLDWLPRAFKYQTDFGMGDMVFLGILLFTNKKKYTLVISIM